MPSLSSTMDTMAPSAMSSFWSHLMYALMQAATDQLLQLDVLACSHSERCSTHSRLMLYLYVSTFYTTSTSPSILLPCYLSDPHSNTRSMHLYRMNADNCPPLSRPFVSEWLLLVPTIRTLSLPGRLALARLVCGLEPSDGCPFDQCLRGIAGRLESIVEAMQAQGICSERVGINTLLPPPASLQNTIVQPPVPSSGAQIPHPASGRKTRSGRISGQVSANAAPNRGKERKKRQNPGLPCPGKPKSSPRSLPALPVGEGCSIDWTCIKPYRREDVAMSSPVRLPLPAHGKPRIWAASREELCQILPEVSRADQNIVFENSETPIIFIEGESWEEERWGGGKVIELLMVAEFAFTVPDFAASSSSEHLQPIQQPEAATTAVPAANFDTTDAWPQVIDEGGTYRFVEEPPPRVVSSRESESYDVLRPAPAPENEAVTRALAALVPDESPPDIAALLHSQQACVPVSLIVCRNATLLPFLLPEGCGCAFLGFFFVTHVQVRTENVSWEVVPGDRPTALLRGRKTWGFRFEWTPGGEDPDSIINLCSSPWWIDTPLDSTVTISQNGGGVQLQHQYTLLPLSFFAIPEQIVCNDADVRVWRGWHCKSCGKLNLQRNLCYQRCDCCSTSNGLPPISVEYVRQVRGTDPTAFPWDRYPDNVPCTSSDGPDGLRRFAYAVTTKATVHHMFTRNRPTPQAEPSRLFLELQAEVELIGQPSAKGMHAGTTVPPYSASYGCPPARGSRIRAPWPLTGAPNSVNCVRELMLRRSQGQPVPADFTINVLTLCAWRTAGNKKGSVLAAEPSPIVLLCLGADVEITFWRRPTNASVKQRTVSAPATTIHVARKQAPAQSAFGTPDSDMETSDEEDEEDKEYMDVAYPPPIESASTATGSARFAAKAKRKGRQPEAKRGLEEALMVTLVHGDLLVVYGAVFEYSIKRTGMSIVLFGHQ